MTDMPRMARSLSLLAIAASLGLAACGDDAKPPSGGDDAPSTEATENTQGQSTGDTVTPPVDTATPLPDGTDPDAPASSDLLALSLQTIEAPNSVCGTLTMLGLAALTELFPSEDGSDSPGGLVPTWATMSDHAVLNPLAGQPDEITRLIVVVDEELNVIVEQLTTAGLSAEDLALTVELAAGAFAAEGEQGGEVPPEFAEVLAVLETVDVGPMIERLAAEFPDLRVVSGSEGEPTASEQWITDNCPEPDLLG